MSPHVSRAVIFCVWCLKMNTLRSLGAYSLQNKENMFLMRVVRGFYEEEVLELFGSHEGALE